MSVFIYTYVELPHVLLPNLNIDLMLFPTSIYLRTMYFNLFMVIVVALFTVNISRSSRKAEKLPLRTTYRDSVGSHFKSSQVHPPQLPSMRCFNEVLLPGFRWSSDVHTFCDHRRSIGFYSSRGCNSLGGRLYLCQHAHGEGIWKSSCIVSLFISARKTLHVCI